MKIQEFKPGIDIYLSNEEKIVLDSIKDGSPLAAYSERQRVVIENLAKKDLVTKIKRNSLDYVVKND